MLALASSSHFITAQPMKTDDSRKRGPPLRSPFAVPLFGPVATMVPQAPSARTFEVGRVGTIGIDQRAEQETNEQTQLALNDREAAASELFALRDAAADRRHPGDQACSGKQLRQPAPGIPGCTCRDHGAVPRFLRRLAARPGIARSRYAAGASLHAWRRAVQRRAGARAAAGFRHLPRADARSRRRPRQSPAITVLP